MAHERWALIWNMITCFFFHSPFDMWVQSRSSWLRFLSQGNGLTTKDMSDMRTLSMLAFETQLGNVWYFLDFVPVWCQNIVLLAVMGLVGLSVMPRFTSSGEIGEAFGNACVLHGAWMLVLMLFFRINFVQYLLPMAFCLSFQMACEMKNGTSLRYGRWAAFWMCIIIFKDFVNNIVRRKLIFPDCGDVVLDTMSLVYLVTKDVD